MSDNRPGEHLRARRGQLHPEAIGFSAHGRRRVPGLRRDEIATMAGLSVDDHTRLEQGRERHPSVQVVKTLRRAPRLDHEARLHLFHVARMIPGPDRGAAPDHRRVNEVLRTLLARSPESARLWERHDARGKRLESAGFHLTLLGTLAATPAGRYAKGARDEP
ncbi:helix-turn-helix domain-containing protein [Microbacterium betulae]|uniref:Helix-turn-helix domain-containing protein n=1 Tax=Microbacterium betulae TaxID=2981139 RepID=A0AA97I5L1_9MICO|nr:helix-turn-helix domain-containing protein [Microbacterium sp. AB]WOF21647.1 helix-turn-helix domain-containing protein [Microbacterium sp. AB]